MEKATLYQAGKILDLFGDTPKDQIQDILGSGFLTDLRDGNITGVKRDDFRKILGLKPLSSLLLLEFIGIVTVPATTKKVVVRDYIANIRKKRKLYTGSNFDNLFLGMTMEPISKSDLCYHKLLKNSFDKPIIAELGGDEKSETTLSEMFALMETQPNGKSGALLTNGNANIFYIRDSDGALWTVLCHWLGDGWRVDADSVEYPRRWHAGYQVFSRNPLKT